MKINIKNILYKLFILFLLYISLKYIFVNIEKFDEEDKIDDNTKEDTIPSPSQTQTQTDNTTSNEISCQLQALNDKMLQNMINTQINEIKTEINTINDNYEELKKEVNINTKTINDTKISLDDAAPDMDTAPTT